MTDADDDDRPPDPVDLAEAINQLAEAINDLAAAIRGPTHDERPWIC